MQFKREMADLVLSGKKTQTRRIKPPRHKVGSIQPVQCGYRDKARAHIRILDVRRQRLGDVTQAEADAEGFKTPLAFQKAVISREKYSSLRAFKQYLISINPWATWTIDTLLTVYEFELVEETK